MSVDKNKFTTINQPIQGDYRDRGSKFLAFAYPVASIEEIKKALENLKKEHPKATHHCYAYRLGTNGLIFRANDDGEPAGSAGKPILNQLDSSGVTNILVVVVRYFGGTLLGVPGLINAYKAATFNALERAEKTEKWIEKRVNLEFEYSVMGEVLYLLKQSEATIYKQQLELFCTIIAGIPCAKFLNVITKLTEVRGVKIDTEI